MIWHTFNVVHCEKNLVVNILKTTWWEIHEENAAQSWGLKYLWYIMGEASPNNDYWNYSAYSPIGDAQRKVGFLFGHHGQAQIVNGVCIWVQKPCYQE
jgi:hypothetical protein